ncbi:helix-turn-helix transcriptional regulator [Yinghuangia sp. ASG 101]|uniref:helix-turn-helix domain-containing protein n=1 Tax=Yinghuangia sp. ASG 101 TaxID=2896848 RepID=UPI001E3879EC|nr:helix-turn-helix transcriptional regulator [Yinghuangia sp. ASG 101]UGQ14743.1 helix-turn-helix transcriptional regulator [Yinghuangia sp. ASG 101]
MQFQERELTPGASPRHLYGAEIRRQRKLVDMSLVALADILGYSRVHVSRFETAERAIPPDLPPKLDVAFGTNGIFVAMYELIKNEVFPDFVRRYMDFESKSIRMRKYVSSTIPGLLQTPGYALAALRAGQTTATDEKIREDVEARLSRQAILARDNPPHLLAVLDEAVLRRPVGSPSTMAEQLRHLLTIGESPRLILQVVPFAHGAHAIMGGSLTLLTQDDGTQTAYLEGSHTGQLIESIAAVTEYELAYDLVRASSLTQEASAAMIHAAIKEYEACGQRLV